MNIAGIDMDLHKEEYIRRYLPFFVTQRIIPLGREDLPEFMERIQLKGYDPFEMMCRSHAICSNNPYYVSRTPDKVIDIDDMTSPVDIPDWDTSQDGWL